MQVVVRHVGGHGEGEWVIGEGSEIMEGRGRMGEERAGGDAADTGYNGSFLRKPVAKRNARFGMWTSPFPRVQEWDVRRHIEAARLVLWNESVTCHVLLGNRRGGRPLRFYRSLPANSAHCWVP